MLNSKRLANGQITAEQFLDRIVYQQADDDFGLMNVEYINILIDDDDEENENADADTEKAQEAVENESAILPIASSSSQASVLSNKLGKCKICSTDEPEMCLLPCFDFCICQSCWNVLQNNQRRYKNELKCPQCGDSVVDAKKMKFSA